MKPVIGGLPRNSIAYMVVSLTRCSTLRYDKELIKAARLGEQAVVQRLLEKGANVNAMSDRGTALALAARGGNNGTNWRHRAVVFSKGHEAVVRLLVENGADVNATCGGTALAWAARFGYVAVVQLLLDKGADVNAKWGEKTALQLAADSGHEAVVRLLITAASPPVEQEPAPAPSRLGIQMDIGTQMDIGIQRGWITGWG